MTDVSVSTAPMTRKTLTACCHCKSVQFAVTVATSDLPLRPHLCHCSICRTTAGTLFAIHAPLPPGVAPQFINGSSLSRLTRYVPPGARETRYFCTTCGLHIGDQGMDDSNWYLSSVIFDSTPANDPTTWDVHTHVFTESAPDGGFATWLPRIGDKTMKTWNPDASYPEVKSQPVELPSGDDALLARCHCGGVEFTIARPPKGDAADDDPDLKKAVSPAEPNKWVACLDWCDDCRLVDGTNVTAWTFVPQRFLTPQPPSDLRIGSSKVYESSKGVRRTFCGTCGATVFYHCEEDSRMVDVAVGILHAREGVKAENWLTWRTGRMAWLEDGMKFDPVFTKSVKEAFEAWGLEKYGQNYDFIKV